MQAPSTSTEDDDADSTISDEPNGLPPPDHSHHPRSASHSVQPSDRRPSKPAPSASTVRRHMRSASGSNPQAQALLGQPPSQSNGALAPPAYPASVGGSPHTAKETFLNYFFGGPGGPGGPGGSGQHGHAGPASQQGIVHAAAMSAPGSESGRRHRDAHSRLGHGQGYGSGSGLMPPPAMPQKEILPDYGKRTGRGLEGAAVYDMRSLGKHLEAVSLYAA